MAEAVGTAAAGGGMEYGHPPLLVGGCGCGTVHHLGSNLPPPTPVRLRGTVKVVAAKVALEAEVADLLATVDAHGSTPAAGCAPSPPPPHCQPPLAHPEGGRRNRHSLSTRGSGPAAMLSVPIVPNRETSVPRHRAAHTIAVVTYHSSARRSNRGWEERG